MTSNLWLKFINRLPFNSEIIGSPRGVYPSTLNWVKSCHPQPPRLRPTYHTVQPSTPIHRTRPPKSVNPQIFAPFNQNSQVNFPETFVVTIPQGRAWSDCTIITHNDYLLADVSNAYVPVEQHPVFKKWKLRPARYFHGKLAVLAVLSGDHNYYHWMFDVLPRLHLLATQGITITDVDYFFMNRCQFPFQTEMLAMLGIPLDRVIECTTQSHVKAEQLIVPSLPGTLFDVPLWACDFLRKTFLIDRNVHPQNTPKRIYINRADASYRKLVNELEVIAYLSKLGFESVSLRSMSVAAQIELFAGAEVIVSPHGAGLTNIIFCQPETKVIELFSAHYLKPYYWFLSNHIPLDYYGVVGQPMIADDHGPTVATYQQDFYIDLKELSQTLQLATGGTDHGYP